MKSGDSLTKQLTRSERFHRLSIAALGTAIISLPAVAYEKNIWDINTTVLPDGRTGIVAFGTGDVPQEQVPVYESNQEKLVALQKSAELLPWCTVTLVDDVVVTDGVKIQDATGIMYPVCADESTIQLGRSDVVTASLRTDPVVEQTVGNVSIYKSFEENPAVCLEAKQQIEGAFTESVLANMGEHYAEELSLQLTVDGRAPLRECGE